MNRFFVEKKNIFENQITINHIEDVKHIYKVLRLSQGEHIEICDGEKHEYICEITFISKSEVISNILERKISKTEPLNEVTLFQGIPKSGKMDIIIQKCTELGIKKIVPVITARTIVQLKDKKTEETKVERWQKIADSAAKQCKRGIIPRIGMPITFDEMLKQIKEYDFSIIPYEKEESIGLKKLLKEDIHIKNAAIIIGPEGGFEENEVLLTQEAGASAVTLGPRILRTETAGFVALSILMYEIGDLGGI